MKEFLGYITVVFIIGVAVIGLMIGLAAWGESWQCGKFQESTGRTTKYEGLICYIQEDGQWYTWEQFKFRQAS